MRAYVTLGAEIDLEERGDYIALDNPKRALTFIQEIRQHCERIGDRPMGTLRALTWAIQSASAHTEIT